MIVTLEKVESAGLTKTGKPRLKIYTNNKWWYGFVEGGNDAWRAGDQVDLVLEEKPSSDGKIMFANFSRPKKAKPVDHFTEDFQRLTVKVEKIAQEVLRLRALLGSRESSPAPIVSPPRTSQAAYDEPPLSSYDNDVPF